MRGLQQDTAVTFALLRLKCNSPTAALTRVLSFRLRDPPAAQFAAASGTRSGLQPPRVGPGHLGGLCDGEGGHGDLCSRGGLHEVHPAHRLLPAGKPLPRPLGHLLLSPRICLPCPPPQVSFGTSLCHLLMLFCRADNILELRLGRRGKAPDSQLCQVRLDSFPLPPHKSQLFSNRINPTL